MKVQDVQEQKRLKEVSRRAFDSQAPNFDEGMCGEHARSLYPHVLREVGRAYGEHARRAGEHAAPLRVLDAGCGTGALAERVLDAAPGCQLTGVDLSAEMLKRARIRLGDRATFQLGDSERLPFADATFDVVVCNDSFHHYPDPKRAAFEIWRVLASGGRLIMGDAWQPQPARSIMNLFMPFSGEGDIRIYSEEELREILGSWFPVVEWRQVSSTACLVCAYK